MQIHERKKAVLEAMNNFDEIRIVHDRHEWKKLDVKQLE